MTLTASNNVNANITAISNTAGLAINPNTSNGSDTASGSGICNLHSGAAITLSGANPSLSIAGQSYIVINGLAALKNMNAGPTAHYALGSNVDAIDTANLSANDSLFLSLSGQAATGNLDSSQKISIGGPFNVRAYGMGSASGDSAAMLSAEYRHQLGLFAQGRLTATAFFDSAYVVVNANPWVAGNNHAHLSGAGLGLNWAHPQQWNARGFIALPLWSVETDKSVSARVWLTVSKGF